MSFKRQYYIANKIIVVTFYVIEVFGLWPYKFKHSNHQMEYSFFSIFYSIVAPSLILFAYVYIGSDLFTEGSKVQRSTVFASLPLQLIVIFYSYLIIISYVILYLGQHLQYKRKKVAYLKCKTIADCMRQYSTECVNIKQFLTKFVVKTLVYDFCNFLLFFYNLTWSSEKVNSKPYLSIIIFHNFTSIFTIRLNTNVFYGGILFFNVVYKQLNKSLSKIFSQRERTAAELFNSNIQLEKDSTLYFELTPAMKAFHSVFSFQITLWITTQLITLITQYFYQYVAVVNLVVTNKSFFERQNVAVLLSIVMTMYELFTTAYACNSLVREARKTTVIIHNLNSKLDLNLNNVEIFSIRLLLNKLKISECGMFELDLKTMHAAFSTISSYLIILIQFELTMKEYANKNV